MTTKDRALSAATVAFAGKGVAGTSLDGLAGELGVTKQTILYHFGSKDGLISAVFTEAAQDLLVELQAAIDISEPGWDRVVATVRASFALAVRRPELLGLLREVNRLGSPWSERVLELLQPLVDRAIADMTEGMANGRFQRGDPQMVLVSAYSVVTGVVSDAELLRAVGLELDLRVAARLRRTLLSFLEAVLMVQQAESAEASGDVVHDNVVQDRESCETETIDQA
ncbi:MAG: TetR/AcrR family transcriptional regulator [Acidimicrobiales bacterium]